MGAFNVYVFLGWASTVIGILQNIPQLRRFYKMKHMDEVDSYALGMRVVAAICSSAYLAELIRSAGYITTLPGIIGNIAGWIFLSITLYFKFYLFKKHYDDLTRVNPEGLTEVNPEGLVY